MYLYSILRFLSFCLFHQLSGQAGIEQHCLSSNNKQLRAHSIDAQKGDFGAHAHQNAIRKLKNCSP